MNHIRWAAWGVVDIEKIASDLTTGGNGQARRNYLRKVREELKALKMQLIVGGSAVKPWYSVVKQDDKKHVAAGDNAFKAVCTWVLNEIGDTAHVGSEDGGVRCAGDEAQVAG